MKITINAAQQSNDDIFKPGTLVCHNDGWLIIVSTAEGCDWQYFAGTVINQNPECRTNRIGDHCTGWRRGEFVKFVGNVVLEQEG